VLVAAGPVQGLAEIPQRVGLTMVVAQLLEDRQGLPLAGDRLVIPPTALVGDAEAVEVGGLALTVAQLPEDGQAGWSGPGGW
jgi:hypothetical protein